MIIFKSVWSEKRWGYVHLTQPHKLMVRLFHLLPSPTPLWGPLQVPVSSPPPYHPVDISLDHTSSYVKFLV